MQKMLQNLLNFRHNSGVAPGKPSSASAAKEKDHEGVMGIATILCILDQWIGVGDVEIDDDYKNNAALLAIPLFDGVDPATWIAMMDQHFKINQIGEDKKVVLATMCMHDTCVH